MQATWNVWTGQLHAFAFDQPAEDLSRHGFRWTDDFGIEALTAPWSPARAGLLETLDAPPKADTASPQAGSTAMMLAAFGLARTHAGETRRNCETKGIALIREWPQAGGGGKRQQQRRLANLTASYIGHWSRVPGYEDRATRREWAWECYDDPAYIWTELNRLKLLLCQQQHLSSSGNDTAYHESWVKHLSTRIAYFTARYKNLEDQAETDDTSFDVGRDVFIDGHWLPVVKTYKAHVLVRWPGWMNRKDSRRAKSRIVFTRPAPESR